MEALDLFLYLPLLIVAVTFFLRHRQRPGKPDSGPATYPIIGCLPSFYKNRFRLLDWYTELLAGSESQTIVVNRVGAGRIVVTANPENVEYVLKGNFPNYPKGKPFTDLIGDLLGCGIFNADGELWASQRKLASHEFSTRSLREFVVSVLEEEVRGRLVPLLEKAARDRTVVDLQDVLKRFTYDTICIVSLGTDPDCLDLSRPPPPLLTSFETAAAICARRAAAPFYAWWRLKRALNVGSERLLRSAVSVVHSSIDTIIADKRSDPSAGSDLLSRLLAAGNDDEMVRDMLVSFIMAGRDTTAAALTWLFWLLTQNRGVEAELRDQTTRLDETMPLDYESLKEMKFAHACLNEAMRLYPPVSWDSKHAEVDDVLPDGTSVPAGTRVTYFPYGMGRMENLWGKDRFEFRPDRWFSESESDNEDRVLKSVSPFVYPVFQAGPRVCLGKEMAFIQMKFVVASLVNRFEFEPLQEGQPGFIPLLTAYMAGGLKVRVKIRDNVACESK
ncbi:hypothetical protein V2J09_011938 [Rumex salicifolius]